MPQATSFAATQDPAAAGSLLQARIAELPYWLRAGSCGAEGSFAEPTPILFGEVVTLLRAGNPSPCTPVLYLGDRETAADSGLLQRLNIRAVVNCADQAFVAVGESTFILMTPPVYPC